MTTGYVAEDLFPDTLPMVRAEWYYRRMLALVKYFVEISAAVSSSCALMLPCS